jgi:hypothetical protein
MATLVGSVAGGGVNDFFAAGELVVTRYQAVASGTVDQAQVNVRTGSTFTSLILVIYSDLPSTPDALLGQSAAITDNTAGTKTAAVSSGPALVSGTFYHVGILALGGAFNFTGNAGVTGYRGQSGLAAPENPWATAGDFTDGSANVGLPVLFEQVAPTVAAALTVDYRRFPKYKLRP